MILELFIDSPTGVTHSDCRAVTHGLDERLETDEWYGRLRAVDVSSPGADAPVRFLWQLQKSVGRTIRVERTDGSVVEAALHAVADESLTLTPKTSKSKKNAGPSEIVISWSDVKEARVILKW